LIDLTGSKLKTSALKKGGAMGEKQTKREKRRDETSEDPRKEERQGREGGSEEEG
jgi:hypothetical protein